LYPAELRVPASWGYSLTRADARRLRAVIRGRIPQGRSTGDSLWLISSPCIRRVYGAIPPRIEPADPALGVGAGRLRRRGKNGSSTRRKTAASRRLLDQPKRSRETGKPPWPTARQAAARYRRGSRRPRLRPGAQFLSPGELATQSVYNSQCTEADRPVLA